MMTARQPIRVCFTALNAFPLFDDRARSPVGGMETRACTLAAGLAERGDFEVQFVVQAPWWFRDRRQGKISVTNVGDGFDWLRRDVAPDVQRVPAFPWIEIRRWSAALAWKLPLLALLRLTRGARPDPRRPLPAYGRIGAEIHCCFGVSAASATVISSAHASRVPSVLFLASNNDLDSRYGPDSGFVNPNGERGDVAWFAIRNAGVIVAQHQRQLDLLKQRFQREGVLLPGVIDFEAWDRGRELRPAVLDAAPSERFALWIGRADDFHKRPLLCLELARECPAVPFVMVLNPANPQIEREVRASRPENVTILSTVPFSAMPSLMSRATLLVSTSSAEFEGAPNVFLQAAASHLPVVSLEASIPLLTSIAPDCVAGGDLEELARRLDSLWRDSRKSQSIAQAARAYVERHHALPVVIDQLAALLHRVVGMPAEPLP